METQVAPLQTEGKGPGAGLVQLIPGTRVAGGGRCSRLQWASVDFPADAGTTPKTPFVAVSSSSHLTHSRSCPLPECLRVCVCV